MTFFKNLLASFTAPKNLIAIAGNFFWCLVIFMQLLLYVSPFVLHMKNEAGSLPQLSGIFFIGFALVLPFEIIIAFAYWIFRRFAIRADEKWSRAFKTVLVAGIRASAFTLLLGIINVGFVLVVFQLALVISLFFVHRQMERSK